MAGEKDTDNPLNDVLSKISAEREGGDVDLKENLDHEGIMSGLPDDNKGEDTEQVSDQGNTPKNESVNKVKIPKGYKKSKSKLLIGGVCVIGVIVVGYFATAPSQQNKSTNAALPSFSNWKMFGGDTKPENDPVVTRSVFDAAMQDLRFEMRSKMSELPTNDQLNELRTQIGGIQRLQNQQKNLIASIVNKTSENSGDVVSQSFFNEQMQLLKGELDSLNAYTGEVLSKTAKLDESTAKISEANKKVAELVNSNWANHLRLNKIESELKAKSSSSTNDINNDNSIVEVNTLKKPETITWNSNHSWVLKIASERFTQIYNKTTGKHLRVFNGVEIPNCGVVLDIDIAARKISTQHCTIGRS